jgi:sterol desaturase/sphingolipid hydroxylase (fatty acid hydroxylase superfamily)
MWLVPVAVFGTALFLILGYRHPRVQQPALRSGLVADLLHAVVNGVLLDLPIALALQSISIGMEQGLGVHAVRLLADRALWLQAAVFLLVGDLVKWTLHMLHHRVPLLWKLHRVHHSTEQMDALSYARSHPLESILNRVVFLTIFVLLLGIDSRIAICYSVLDLLQGLWIHSNTHVHTPLLNYILATQEFHHWHHAMDSRAINRNYGGFLSVWDWVFGTAYCPSDREVPGFGTTDASPAPTRYRDHLLLPFRNGGRGRRPAEASVSSLGPMTEPS